ncbi:MAG: hypothetical protein HYS89_01770 [Candidatus Colwellbacteria bacterium]|nr:hypothetical protein [Candidatus Colwellbacteria bacterium]
MLGLVWGIRSVLAENGGGTGGGQGGGTGGEKIKLENPLEVGSVEEVLDTIAGFLFTISIPLLTVMILLGGFFILTAAGNPQRLQKGKQIIVWGIIGFVIILLAGGVSTLVSNILGSDESGGSSFCYEECLEEGNTPSECRGLPSC